MRLTLEDSTARIHAYIFVEDRKTLFDGNSSVKKEGEHITWSRR